MNALRIFFVGGLTSYRALFNWISPWVYIPHTLGYPVFEILFFAYLGRFAGVQSDKFFLIGNAFMAIAVTGFFGMGNAIGGERRSQSCWRRRRTGSRSSSGAPCRRSSPGSSPRLSPSRSAA